jgi:hypothetical protein
MWLMANGAIYDSIGTLFTGQVRSHHRGFGFDTYTSARDCFDSIAPMSEMRDLQ